MAQLFSNNADTQLAAPLSDSATTATLADGSSLNTPTGGDFELLTLIAAGNVEIVRTTARTGNTITIARAQEGTTARFWVAGTRVFAGVTAGTLTALASSEGGITNNATGTEAVAIGEDAYADATRGFAFGHNAGASGNSSIAIGTFSRTSGEDSIALGQSANAAGLEAISIGAYSSAAPDQSIAIGPTTAHAEHAFQVAGLYTVPRGEGTGADAVWTMSAGAAVIMSQPLTLTGTPTHTITIPAGLRFFVDEIGVVVIDANTVTVQPTMRFGITGTEAKFSAAALTTGLTAAHNRHRITSLDSADGVTTLRSEVTVAATATTLTGRVYWRGFAVTDDA